MSNGEDDTETLINQEMTALRGLVYLIDSHFHAASDRFGLHATASVLLVSAYRALTHACKQFTNPPDEVREQVAGWIESRADAIRDIQTFPITKTMHALRAITGNEGSVIEKDVFGGAIKIMEQAGWIHADHTSALLPGVTGVRDDT